MRISSKLIVSALIGSAALGAAIPAQAQSYPDRNRYDDRRDYDDRRGYDDRYDSRYNRGQVQAIARQIEQLEQRVQRVDARERISEREAAGLRRAVYNLRQQYRDYARNGLTQREAQVLRSRIQQVHERLHDERRDRDGRRW